MCLFSTGEAKNVTISPAEPIYFGYNFTGQTESSSVLVQVESDSDICMTVSIQNTTVRLLFILCLRKQFETFENNFALFFCIHSARYSIWRETFSIPVTGKPWVGKEA